jgi:alkaline phosphatase D
VAPPKFLGDKSSFYGGSLSFDLRLNGTAYMFDKSERTFGIKSDNKRIIFLLDAPGVEFKNYHIPLTESGWVVVENRLPVSREEFQEVLKNLREMWICGDYRNAGSQELAYLDNVIMAPPKKDDTEKP